MVRNVQTESLLRTRMQGKVEFFQGKVEFLSGSFARTTKIIPASNAHAIWAQDCTFMLVNLPFVTSMILNEFIPLWPDLLKGPP